MTSFGPPHQPDLVHPSTSLLTIKRFPSSKLDNDLKEFSDIILSVFPSSDSPFKFRVQHYYPSLRSSALCPTFENYLIDLQAPLIRYDDPPSIITAIELTNAVPKSFSPSLSFGTSDGQLFLTRSNFCRPYLRLRQLHRSPVICLTSCPIHVQPNILISGSSTELLLWDLDARHDQPICLRAFGRQNPQLFSDPYSAVLLATQLRQVSSEQIEVVAEFKDDWICCWDLKSLLKIGSTPLESRVFSRPNVNSRFLLDACCISTEAEEFHVYTINPEDGSIEQSSTGRRLCRLPGVVSRLVCTRCDHENRKIELLALFRGTRKLMQIVIDDTSNSEVPIVSMTCIESDCILFHYDRTHGLLATAQSINPELSLRQIDKPFQVDPSYCFHAPTPFQRSEPPITSRGGGLKLEVIEETSDVHISNIDLIKLLRDELDQSLKFPTHLRLAIYKRMLIKSKSEEEELSTTYYRLLACPSPESFLKKFRAAWKLEQAEFQFSLETLLTIFHGMGLNSESWLIDKLAPILYGFLKILDDSPKSHERYKSESEEESLRLVEIFQVCRWMIERFGEGAFEEKGDNLHDRKMNYQNFVEKVTRKLSGDNLSSIGRSLLRHLESHSVSIGKDCLPRLTHGFLMGFTSPESFESLMDHLVTGHCRLESLTDLCVKLLEYFGFDIMRLSTRKDILNFFSLTHGLNLLAFRNLSYVDS